MKLTLKLKLKRQLLRAWRFRHLWLESWYRKQQLRRAWYTLLHVLHIRRIMFEDGTSYDG